MRAWSRASPGQYQALDLRAHALLAAVPLHDVWQVELPGGGPGRTIEDVRALLRAERLRALGPAVRALFALRWWLGRVLGWDAPRPDDAARSYRQRLSAEDRARSQVAPGTPDGPFAVLYVHEREAVSEIRNATVHAFSVLALEPRTAGYRLLWAIHVARVGWLTRFYMALIDPFRRLVVYPAVLGYLGRAWRAAYPEAAGGSGEQPARSSSRTAGPL